MKLKIWFVLFILIAFALVLGILALDPEQWNSIASAQGPTGGRRSPNVIAVGTGFTYQGQLKNNGALVNGTCTLAFRLYDDSMTGNQIGSPITQTIPITNGLFTTLLNTSNEFGATAFNGDARWLEIRVSNACPSTGSFTTLNPREPITPTPYAFTAMKTAYKNVLVVAKQGGHYNTITDALNSIGSSASASNTFLIWVAPGTYTETVTMKQYVDIEGAGELTTKITQVGSGLTATGSVVGASNAELRFLTVENTGGNSYAVAIYNSSVSPRLTHVSATASGGTSGNYGVFNNSSSPMMTNVTATTLGGWSDNGVYNNFSSPTMNNVTATASGGTYNTGVYNDSSSPTIHTSRLSGAGGPNNYGIYNRAFSGTYTVTVNHSEVTGSTNTIYNDSHFSTRVGASQLSGGAVAINSGTLTCIYAYNASYAALNSTCQ